MGGVDLKLARLLFVNTLIVLTTNSVIVGVRLLRTYREHETTKENSGMANKKKNFSPSKVSTNPGKKIRACLHKRSLCFNVLSHSTRAIGSRQSPKNSI